MLSLSTLNSGTASYARNALLARPTQENTVVSAAADSVDPATGESVRVSISPAAREAAKNDGTLSTGDILPPLPDNQALLASVRREMAAISSQGLANASPEELVRYNRLSNLSQRLQQFGGQGPVGQAEIQSEREIAQALARLAAENLAPSGLADGAPARAAGRL